MQQIIDRRLAGKNKSIGNRERFLRRHKEQIREAVKRAVDGRGIRDIAQGEDIHIPKRDISEPVFGHGQGGMREMVHPGNQEYVRGDRIERPKGGGGGGGGGQASDSGEGEDDFVFHLSKEEFMQVFFDDLALPQPGAHHAGRNARVQDPPRRLLQRRHAEQPARRALDARRHRPAHRAGQRVAARRCANSRSSWRC